MKCPESVDEAIAQMRTMQVALREVASRQVAAPSFVSYLFCIVIYRSTLTGYFI